MRANDATIITWTLAGPGSGEIIGDALRSAEGLAEAHLAVLTSENGACDLLAAIDDAIGIRTDRALVRFWLWRNDFAAARNAALEYAGDLAAWGVMLDADERIVCSDPAALRRYLAELPDGVQVV